MAITVPTPERQVGEGDLPVGRFQPDAPLEAFGGGPGLEAATTAGRQVAASAGEIAAFARISADQLAVTDATSQLSRKATDLMYDPEHGLINLHGKDAQGAIDIFGQQYPKIVSDISKGLHTPEQQGAFARVAQNMQATTHRALHTHVYNEGKKYDQDTTNALISNEQDAAALNYGDPARVGDAMKRQEIAIKEFSKRNGLSDEDQQKLLRTNISLTHEGIIKRMLGDGQDLMAQSYLTANKDQIDAKVLDALRPIMKEGTLRGASQRNADDIWKDTGGDFGKAMGAARKLTDPEVRERTEQEIRKMDEDKRRAITDGQESAYLGAYKIIQQKGLTDPSAIRNAIDPATWIQMGPEHAKALLRAGADIPTDGTAYMKFLDLARNPNNLAKLSTAEYYTQYRSKFSPEDQKHADSIFEAASRSEDKVTVQKAELDDVILQTGIIPGYNPKKANGNQAKAFVAFEAAARKEILNWESVHNKLADTDEKKQILNKLAAKQVFVHNAIFPDAQKPAAVLIGDDRGRAYVPLKDIPEAEKNALESYAKKIGKMAGPDKIQRAYAAVVMGDADRVKTILGE